MLQTRDKILSQQRANINRAQQRMRHQANKHRKDVCFSVGDYVYVKLKPYRQDSVNRRSSQKLAMRFYGPYQISEKIREVVYRLELPAIARIHNLFHVSILKLCPNPTHHIVATLPDFFLGPPPTAKPHKLLGIRYVDSNGTSVRQALIQWDTQAESDATWEDLEQVRHNFLSF
ncbi:unnamed protein product [Rhodiola kirilowii]